jgi:hypothetical protein
VRSDWTLCPRVALVNVTRGLPDLFDTALVTDDASCGPPNLPRGSAQYIETMQQGRWRYNVDIAGDTCGDSLNRRLLTGSLIVHLRNRRYEEFSHGLLFSASPPVVRVASDVPDIISQVRAAVADAAGSRAMAARGEAWAREYLSWDCRQAYWRALLERLPSLMGEARYAAPTEFDPAAARLGASAEGMLKIEGWMSL